MVVKVVHRGVLGSVLPRQRGACRERRCGRGRREALLLLLGVQALNRRYWDAGRKRDCELAPCNNPFRVGMADFLKVAEVGSTLNPKKGGGQVRQK